MLVFVTVCTKHRRPLLANAAAHACLLDVWRQVGHWMVGRYVILPDHVHLFCAPGVWPPESLTGWIGCWKNLAARSWPASVEKPLWQRDGWDTQLRQGESYGAKWDYVRTNPVRHGLVDDPDEWPHQGEMNILSWHDR